MPTSSPRATTEFAKELISYERRNFVAWAQAIEAQPNNPFNAHIRQFGDATAILNTQFKSPIFNRVFEMTLHDVEHLPDILAFYKQYHIRPMFDLSPYISEPYTVKDDITLALAKNGLYQGGFHQLLYAIPTEDVPATPDNLDITIVDDSSADDFASVYEWYSGDGRVIRLLIGHPEYTCYLTRIDGEPAAIGLLHVADGVGSMATGVTLPEFRNRGSQTALLYRRMKDAVQKGCHLMVSQCRPGGSSQNNQLRVGFEIVGTKVWWTTLNPNPWD
jgi:hypothetical protein